MADKTADATKFLLRLPPALHKRLVVQARRNKISLNQEIVNQLEGYEAAMVKRTTGIMQPVIKSSAGGVVVQAIMQFVKPEFLNQEAVEQFKAEEAKAGAPSPSPKIRDDDEGERKKE
jgi:hypothetical protein